MYGDAKEGTTAAGVSLYGRGSVGNYDYVVASASESDKLIDWLNENHYQVPEKAKSSLQSYINKGWKFFVAKLKTEPGLSPHPVMLKFRSKNLVYPMALTATMPPPLNLDLFVVSDRIAFNKDTITYAADKIHASYLTNGLHYGRIPDNAEKTPAWQYDLFYPGCVISRLSGNFKDKIPTNDMFFSYKRFNGLYQATLYSKDAAKQNATAYALLAFSILTVIVGAIMIERKVSPYRVWAAALALAVLSLCFGYWRFAAVQLQPYDEDVYSRY